MDRWQNRVAVITGASSGIGDACAKHIVAAGIQVVGLARRTERMVQLKDSLPEDQRQRFHFHQCDVTKENEVQEAFDWIETKFGGTDILINNAGILREGNLMNMPTKDIRDVVKINFMGAVYCMQQAFKSMQKRNYAGHLIFINSTAGLPGYDPGQNNASENIYAPTKCALRAVNEVCRQELIAMKTKIKTTNISPGWVSTELVPQDKKAELGDVILQADDIAQAVIYALSTPPHTQVHEITLRAVGEWF